VAILNSDNLIWIDLEMTGLKPDADEILEIATVVTDKELNVIDDGPQFAISQPETAAARARQPHQPRRGGTADAAVPAHAGAGGSLAHVR
jgi:oligoribonuclease (3'-5' exoribonuclease)